MIFCLSKHVLLAAVLLGISLLDMSNNKPKKSTRHIHHCFTYGATIKSVTGESPVKSTGLSQPPDKGHDIMPLQS